MIYVKKAYSIISNFSKEAINILEKNNIGLTLNTSEHIPNTNELISLLEQYDILINGEKSE